MGRAEIEAALRETTGFVAGIEEAQRRLDLDIPHEITDWPCPDILWQGLFAVVADRLKKRSWEIWLGTLVAMGATAHKHLHWHYHRPLYGMVYGLLISPTGHGKGICADVCQALLPEGYTVRDSVQSGPALFPILAKIDTDVKGVPPTITPRPAVLIIEEWTTLLKSSKIEFSNLQETLNNLWHRSRAWNISRSDTERGGGDREIADVTLSICATTTNSLLREQVTPSMMRSGFLNRYLVVPGSHAQWSFYDPDMAGVDAAIVKGLLDHLALRTCGGGRNVWHAYTPEARERLVQWGEPLFGPLMQRTTLEAESLKRLHTYVHIVALLYSWSDQCSTVSLSHVEAAIAAIAISKAFVEQLIGEPDVEIPKFKQYEMNLEEKVLAKIRSEPGITARKVCDDLRRNAPRPDILRVIALLISTQVVREERQGKTKALYVNE